MRICSVSSVIVKLGVENLHRSSFFWGTTNSTWDLKGSGSKEDLTPVSTIYVNSCGCETSAQDFGSDFGRSRSRVEGRRTTEVGSRRK